MIIQRLFSSNEKKPVRPKTEKQKYRHLASTTAGLVTLPLSPILYGGTVENEESKINKGINSRIQETIEAAQKGDPKAVERIIKINNDPIGFRQKMSKAANNSLRLKKAKIKGAAKAAIPVALLAYGINGTRKTLNKNEKALKNYRKELKDWEKNKE